MSVFNNKAKAPLPDQASLPPGTHAAILVAVIDLGTHPEEFQGVTKKTRSLYFVWEVPEEKALHGETYSVADGLSTKSRLRIMLESWRGKKYGAEEAINVLAGLGKACLLTITHKQGKNQDRTFPQLAAVSNLPKNFPAPTPSRQPISWELGSGPLPDVDWLPWCFVGGSRMSVKDAVSQCEERKPQPAPAPAQTTRIQTNGQAAPTVTAAQMQEEDIPF